MKFKIQMVLVSTAVMAMLIGPSAVSATKQFAVLDAGGYLKQPLTETPQAGPGPVCPGVCLVR